MSGYQAFRFGPLMNVAADGSAEGEGGAGATVVDPAAPKGDTKTVDSITLPKDAFDKRLKDASEAATRKLLKELGFEKVEDLASRLKTAKAADDEKKTELERLREQVKELEPHKARAASIGALFEAQVNAAFSALPERMQTAIDSVAKGDAEARFHQIEVLRAAGLLDAPSSGAASGTPPATPPRTQGAPPPPPRAGEARTKWDEHQELIAKRNPMADVFGQIHAAAIRASRPADK